MKRNIEIILKILFICFFIINIYNVSFSANTETLTNIEKIQEWIKSANQTLKKEEYKKIDSQEEGNELMDLYYEGKTAKANISKFRTQNEKTEKTSKDVSKILSNIEKKLKNSGWSTPKKNKDGKYETTNDGKNLTASTNAETIEQQENGHTTTIPTTSSDGDIRVSSSPESGTTLENPLDNLDDYKVDNVENASKLKEKAGGIVGALTTIGVAVSVIALIGIGIRYMISSVEEKADLKATLVPYVIGAIMVFSISLITGFIYDIAKNL